MTLKILFIGDVVGKIGRKAVALALPEMKKESGADCVIVNGENAAHGHGITQKNFDEFMEAGVDFITLGDHAFDRKEASELLEIHKDRIIRPANFPSSLPGSGHAILEVGSRKILIINLVGRVFMKKNYDNPFTACDAILKKYSSEKLSGIIVDFQAEATSEKSAMGWYLDGRVSALLGTHTHVPTADQKILPLGTAFVSDVGMVGAIDSIIGMKKEPIMQSFLDQSSALKEPPDEGECQINAVVVEIDPKNSRAVKIKRLDKNIIV